MFLSDNYAFWNNPNTLIFISHAKSKFHIFISKPSPIYLFPKLMIIKVQFTRGPFRYTASHHIKIHILSFGPYNFYNSHKDLQFSITTPNNINLQVWSLSSKCLVNPESIPVITLGNNITWHKQQATAYTDKTTHGLKWSKQRDRKSVV